MRLKFPIIMCLMLLLGSCQNVERSPRPDDLIPHDKMVEVLTELSLLHGARSYNKTLLEEKGIRPQDYLWEKFDIDSLQFLRSNNYYAENYKQYQQIYGRVQTRLEEYKARFDSLRELEERDREDSLEISGDTIRDPQRILRGGSRDSLLPVDTLINIDSLQFEEGELSREAIHSEDSIR